MGVRLLVRSRPASSAAGSGDDNEERFTFEFDQPLVVIGRAAGTDVQLPHQAVSLKHATLRPHGAAHAIQDEGSTNGTLVNGVRLAPGRPKPLRNGDVINIAHFELRFEGGIAVATQTTAERTATAARAMVRALLDGDDDFPPRLVVLNGPDQGVALELEPAPSRIVIGRGEHCELRLQDGDASREHAAVLMDLEGALILDMESKNGVWINGRSTQRRRLKDRDEIQIGGTVLSFEDLRDQRLQALQSEPDAQFEDFALLPEEAAREQPSADRDAALAARAERIKGVMGRISFPPSEGLGSEAGRAALVNPGSEGEPKEAAPPTDAADGNDGSTSNARETRPRKSARAPGGASTPKRDSAATTSRQTRSTRAATSDMIIYGLAAVVLAVSLAGLAWLLGGA